MKMTNLEIENYKGLRKVTIPLSPFTCLVGENNAGKSSVLQGFALFFSGSTLPKTHYFDTEKPIRIEVIFQDITAIDIDRLAEEHRTRINMIVNNGTLTLVRVYEQDGKSKLKYRKLIPKEERFSDSKITEIVKGQKPGKTFVENIVKVFPELIDIVTAEMNQGDMKAKIQELADKLPDTQKIISDVDLPTGIDKSISALLPEPIYIPAVKDLKDDVKTNESTPFGKVLSILLKAIEPHLAEEKTLFEQLNKKLNRFTHLDGTEKDERLDPVRKIEETVERFVQDTFKAVKLSIKIPPPELKTVLSSAQIYADDGVDGLIESKGDGLRRAIVFAVLRSYVELSTTGLIYDNENAVATETQHLLLFEEPELYLHPKAQQILFEAFGAFSQKHPVVVTTHSPAFFGPLTTTTFVKVRKKMDLNTASKPFGVAYPINLIDTEAKDQFQIICYENNNIAFFAETVVLVEGDSDYIVLPHLARTINPAWDCGQLPIRFARIGGKSNFQKYKLFFNRFETRVLVITDLDFLLGTEFAQIVLSSNLITQRDQLIAAVDKVIDKNGGVTEPNGERIKDAHEKGSLRSLWRKARDLHKKQKEGSALLDDVTNAVDEFFAWEKYWERRDILRQCSDENLFIQKRSLLDNLREVGVYVWEKGSLEDYYPSEITGVGKPAKAQSFNNTIKTKDQALKLCNDGHKGIQGALTSEFEAIFETIFTV